MSDRQIRLAVLIDAENAQKSILAELMTEIARYGTPTIKRAYADWTTPDQASWKQVLLRHSIQPIQQFRFTKGKNASDSALIIDAMDVLHGGHVDGFCIVSSDSDFTRLCSRIREAGLVVYGFGEEKTPEPFRVACDKFIFTEILAPKNGKVALETAPNDIKGILKSAIEAAVGEDGWALLGQVGSIIQAKNPSFDPRNYGHSRLSQLVESLGFEVERRGEHKHPYVRSK